MRTWRIRLSPSMVVAFIALVLALGGASYAAVKLPARSVGSKELKRSAVAKINIRSNAVDGSKVVNESLTGRDINESSLAGVASALNSNHAAAAAGLDAVAYRSAAGTVGPAGPGPTTTIGGAAAACDVGQVVVGGGVKVDAPSAMAVHDSHPEGARVWSASVGNDDEASAHGFTVFAICVPAATVG
jgi:hypothetical protein